MLPRRKHFHTVVFDFGRRSPFSAKWKTEILLFRRMAVFAKYHRSKLFWFFCGNTCKNATTQETFSRCCFQLCQNITFWGKMKNMNFFCFVRRQFLQSITVVNFLVFLRKHLQKCNYEWNLFTLLFSTLAGGRLFRQNEKQKFFCFVERQFTTRKIRQNNRWGTVLRGKNEF